ncbi:hypothetical protein A2U01_0056191, partial [Trifolium medium]|nr:hypothetical protein [Trifolium medium]
GGGGRRSTPDLRHRRGGPRRRVQIFRCPAAVNGGRRGVRWRCSGGCPPPSTSLFI